MVLKKHTCDMNKSKGPWKKGKKLNDPVLQKLADITSEDYKKGEEFFVPMSALPKHAKAGVEFSINGYKVKQTELDHYHGSAGTWVKVLSKVK